MRALIQRVDRASVSVDGKQIASINKGLLVFIGITHEDQTSHADYLAKKIVNTRIFNDPNGVMNLSIKDISGQLLIVSQFTLYADTKKGNRPSYIAAAPPNLAKSLYDYFVERIKILSNLTVATGKFGAHMQIELLNNGPVTIFMEK